MRKCWILPRGDETVQERVRVPESVLNSGISDYKQTHLHFLIWYKQIIFPIKIILVVMYNWIHTYITPTRLWWATNVTHLKTWQTALRLGYIFVVSGHFRLGKCISSLPVTQLIWCALIGHFLLYSITVKCLNFTNFWTPDEVGDETNVW